MQNRKGNVSYISSIVLRAVLRFIDHKGTKEVISEYQGEKSVALALFSPGVNESAYSDDSNHNFVGNGRPLLACESRPVFGIQHRRFVIRPTSSRGVSWSHAILPKVEPRVQINAH